MSAAPRPRWWLLASALALVPLLIAGGLYSLSRLADANHWLQHTTDVRISIARLLSSILDAETGVRGSLLSNDPELLAPFERARVAWPQQLTHLRALTADNPAQQTRLVELDALGRQRFQQLDRLRSEADKQALMREGRATMEALRAVVAGLEDEEVRLDELRQQSFTSRWHTTLAVFFGSTLLLLVAVVGGWGMQYRADASQRQAETRFRTMIESVNDYAILSLDPTGHVATWNRGAQRIKGWSAEEIIGQHFSRFYPEEDVRAGKIERELEIVAREGRFEEEGWRVRKDGSRFWANVVINAVKDERGQLLGYTKVTRDLTERREAAAALADEAQRRTHAEAESRFAQMFIAILGHDLRNPLNAISMAARLLKKKSQGDTKTLDRIVSSAQRMSNMVDQLLDLTRTRLAGGIPIVRKSEDFRGVASAVIEELQLAHPERSIRLEARGGGACATDPDRMAQVVSNLVGNAIQHSPASSPITVQVDDQPGQVTLSVHNAGPPIPADLLPHLFEPYRRVSARSQRSKGLGLGLYITKEVVEAHGGHLEVSSIPDVGTTFTVVLPCPATVAAAPKV